MQDLTVVFGAQPYIGFVSQLGILLWAAAAAVCFFCAKVVSKAHPLKKFLLVSGLLTLMLGMDDAFLLHEAVFPHIGVPEKVVLGAYCILGLLYVIRFQRVIETTAYVLLWLALAGFAASVALDVLPPPGVNPYLFEDGAKLLGIVAWMSYFLSVGAAALRGSAMPGAAAIKHACAQAGIVIERA
jgi:hypothetical protein